MDNIRIPPITYALLATAHAQLALVLSLRTALLALGLFTFNPVLQLAFQIVGMVYMQTPRHIFAQPAIRVALHAQEELLQHVPLARCLLISNHRQVNA